MKRRARRNSLTFWLWVALPITILTVACNSVETESITSASPDSPSVLSEVTVTPSATLSTDDFDIGAYIATFTDAELEEDLGFSLVPFAEELELYGQRSSLALACRSSQPGAPLGIDFVTADTVALAARVNQILDNGMGGAALACAIEKTSSLGGTTVTLIYDLLSLRWVATENALKQELIDAGIPASAIEGSYVEYDFFPSGNFRISDVTAFGYSSGHRADINFLTTDVVFGLSDPEDVCADPGETVPPGPGVIGELVTIVTDELQKIVDSRLERICVTWGEYGSFTAVDLQLFTSTAPPRDSLEAIQAVMESFGADETTTEGHSQFGGVAFSNASIAGLVVAGIANVNGNSSFMDEEGTPVPGSFGLTITMQIEVGS